MEITVLFADLSSFTELTQDLGAGKTHEVVDSFLRMATDVLVKHGAFIDKYVGDAVMALFNVPIRQNDHARRAVTAAAEIGKRLDTLGSRLELPLEASIGIATGHAHVGRLGSDDSKDYTAIGDVVNLAARLQGKAAAGEILVSAESYGASPPDAAAQREEIVLKGFRQPVAAYRLNSRGSPAPPEEVSETAPARASLGAVIFSILGAPCAVATLIGPLAVALGAGGFFGLLGALQFLDQSIVRVPILILVTLAALANLYTLRRARTLRAEAKVPAHLKTMTALEKRRTSLVLGTSSLTLAIVLFEVVAHALRH